MCLCNPAVAGISQHSFCNSPCNERSWWMASRSRHFLWRLAAILAELSRQVTFSMAPRLLAVDSRQSPACVFPFLFVFALLQVLVLTYIAAYRHVCCILAGGLLLSTVSAPHCMETVGTCPKMALRVLIFPMCPSRLTCCLLWLTSMMTTQAVAAGIKIAVIFTPCVLCLSFKPRLQQISSCEPIAVNIFVQLHIL